MQKAGKYTDRFFWLKIKKYASLTGRKIAEPALVLYHCMKDRETPAHAKATIIGALAYFILPTDAISDFLPFIGFTDDLTVMVTTFKLIKKYVKDSHKQKGREQAYSLIKAV